MVELPITQPFWSSPYASNDILPVPPCSPWQPLQGGNHTVFGLHDWPPSLFLLSARFLHVGAGFGTSLLLDG